MTREAQVSRVLFQERMLSDHPEGFTPPEDDEPAEDADPSRSAGDSESEQNLPIHGHVQHSSLSARVPDAVMQGVFSNGVMILTGQFEVIIDFVLRMGEQQRIVSRCVLPRPVAFQFQAALRENVVNYEARFGGLQGIPKALPLDEESDVSTNQGGALASDASHPENQPAPPVQPQIQDLYDDLKIPEALMSGRYANAVLIRHSATEFCFDFITNFYPRSAVSARVFLAAPHIRPFLTSLEHALTPPGTSEGFA